MRNRLAEELERVNIKMRPASINAGLGGGYLSSVISDGVEPSVEKLARICNANGLSFPYVVLGLKMTTDQQRLLTLIGENPDRAEHIASLLEKS
ncbi:hypothetical protein [Ascidiaceihabitans sp.]